MNDLSSNLIAIYIFVFGLCLGSFLNVVILRGLANEEFVRSRSKCPKCNNQLTWYMNIPVLSYIFLKGRCAFCNEHISFQYPLVELVCGFCFLGAFLAFGLTLKTLFICLILSFFILLAGTDFKQMVIIDTHAYILAIIGVLYTVFKLSDITIIESLVGGFLGFIFFEFFARVAQKIIGTRMFGEGDSLIAVALGTIFGYKTLFLVIALSFIIQCFIAIPFIGYTAFKDKKFFLSISYLVVFVCILCVFCVNYFDLFSNEGKYLIFAFCVCVLLFWALKNILKEMSLKKRLIDNNENDDIKKTAFCFMPFGPALIFSSVICLFFLPQIKEILLKFIN